MAFLSDRMNFSLEEILYQGCRSGGLDEEAIWPGLSYLEPGLL